MALTAAFNQVRPIMCWRCVGGGETREEVSASSLSTYSVLSTATEMALYSQQGQRRRSCRVSTQHWSAYSRREWTQWTEWMSGGLSTELWALCMFCCSVIYYTAVLAQIWPCKIPPESVYSSLENIFYSYENVLHVKLSHCCMSLADSIISNKCCWLWKQAQLPQR